MGLAKCCSFAPWGQSGARTREKKDEVGEKSGMRRRSVGKSAIVNGQVATLRPRSASKSARSVTFPSRHEAGTWMLVSPARLIGWARGRRLRTLMVLARLTG